MPLVQVYYGDQVDQLICDDIGNKMPEHIARVLSVPDSAAFPPTEITLKQQYVAIEDGERLSHDIELII